MTTVEVVAAIEAGDVVRVSAKRLFEILRDLESYQINVTWYIEVKDRVATITKDKQ